MSSFQKDEIKYHMLRNQLDKLKFLQSLDYNSLDLVEALLNEVISLRRKNESIKQDTIDLKEKNEQYILGIAAYKQQNKELFKQNSELHNEIINLLEKQNYRGKDIEIKRLNEDSNSFRFLLNAAKEKNQMLQRENVQIKQKYIELIVDIYEKKVNLGALFKELKDTEQISMKPRRVFGYSDEDNMSSISNTNMNININSNLITQNNNNNYINNSNNKNKNNNNNNNNNISYIPLGRGGKNSNKEMIEKIFNLENELKEKNSEIALLKKNLSSESILDQRVVVDYLKNELKNTKEKYDWYIKYQKEQTEKVQKNQKKKQSQKKSFEGNEVYDDLKNCRKRAASLNQKKKIEGEMKFLKSKYDNVRKENGILKKEIANIIERYNSSENYIQDALEKEFTDFSNKTAALKLKEAEVNLLTSLSHKIKEADSKFNSAEQHFKNQMNEMKKFNDTLKEENKNLKEKIEINNKTNAEYKEKINLLNKKIFQLSNSKDIKISQFSNKN